MLVNERVTGEIGIGLVVLLGVAKGDTSGSARYLAEKTATVRIFADKAGKMNLSPSTSTGPRSLFRNSPSMATPVASDGQVSSRPPRPTKPTGSTKILRCAAPSRRARADRHFPNDDVPGADQRRSGDHPPGLRKALLSFVRLLCHGPWALSQPRSSGRRCSRHAVDVLCVSSCILGAVIGMAGGLRRSVK